MNRMSSPALFETAYNRSDCEIGIVHLGFGAFHRAHQALYVDDYMDQTGDLRWGIAAVNLRAAESPSFASLKEAQHGYVLKSMSGSGEIDFRRVRSHVKFFDWADNAKEPKSYWRVPRCIWLQLQ